MGVDLKELVPRTEITLEALSGRTIAVDAYNALYQFLAIIRQPTGEPLTDAAGRVTSHLSGLLYRNANLIEKGIRLVYVFDGAPPSLKAAEIQRRLRVKEEAVVKYEQALAKGRLEEAKMYAQMTSHLKDSMVEDALRLLTLLGVPWVKAPSEGEAQAAFMARRGDVWAVASQDYDALLFDAPRIVRNLAITGRRKLPKKDVYVEVAPELISLDEVLAQLQLTREQLIDIGILVGTDFNPEGVKGVGPKTALKLIREHGGLDKVLAAKPDAGTVNFAEIREIFLNPKVSGEYRLEWRPPDVEGVVRFLCGERGFSEDRVRKALEKIGAGLKEEKAKKTLEAWF